MLLFLLFGSVKGRRRRSIEDEVPDDVSDADLDEGPAMEMLNRAVRELQESANSSLKESNNKNYYANLESTKVDDGDSNGNKTDDSLFESTTEIIEFNLDGKLNKYIVKKEVQAVIVDIPELLDSSDSPSKNSFI